MENKRTFDEGISMPPLLIIDKAGVIGEAIANALSHEFLPIVVTSTQRKRNNKNNSIVISWNRQAPKIPKNTFTAIFAIENNVANERHVLAAAQKEAKTRNIPFVIFLQKENVSNHKIQNIQKSYAKTLLFIIGEILVEGIAYGEVGGLISDAKINKRIVLQGNGLGVFYPVSLDFVIKSFIKTFFVKEQVSGVVCLFSPHGHTALAIARMLQKVDPFVVMDFSKTNIKKHKTETALHQAQYIEESAEELLQVISNMYISRITAQIGVKKKENKNWKKKIVIILASFIAACVFICLFFVAVFFYGIVIMRFASSDLLSGRIDSAGNNIKIAKNSFLISSFAVKALQNTGLVSDTDNVFYPVTLAEKGVLALDNIATAAVTYKKLYSKEENVSKGELVKANNFLRVGLTNLESLTKEKEFPENYKKILISIKPLSDMFIASYETLPEILGFSKDKKYLIILQNSNELRPGGGFIGSYALLTLSKGKVQTFSFHDVYDADGQLKGHVDPPYALQKYLGIQHWYLRDSNFSVDNIENASREAFFLALETGEKVDGVMALDTAVMEDFIGAVGDLPMPDYNVVLTSKNFTQKTQEQIEDGFFPGSTKKKDFLSNVYQKFTEKVYSGNQKNKELLLKTLSKLLIEKHILFAFSEPEIQQAFTLLGVSSSLADTRQEGSEIVNDTVGINEANIGVNKVNAYVKRDIHYDTIFDESGKLQTTVALKLNNTSGPTQRFGGSYKTYIRFIIPKEGGLTGLSIDGIQQVVLTPLNSEAEYKARGEVAKNSIEVVTEILPGHLVYGFFTEVNPSSVKEIAFTYQYPDIDLRKKSSFTYSQRLFKQPGTRNDPYTYSFSYPESYQVLKTSPELWAVGAKIIQSGRLNTDKKIEILISKK